MSDPVFEFPRGGLDWTATVLGSIVAGGSGATILFMLLGYTVNGEPTVSGLFALIIFHVVAVLISATVFVGSQAYKSLCIYPYFQR